MTTTYGVETVLSDVGYIRATEKLAIHQILGFGTAVTHNRMTNELHLGWNIDADAMDSAIDAARIMHFRVCEATGVYVPRTSLFQVRELHLE